MIMILPFFLAVSGLPEGCQSIDRDYLIAADVPALTKLAGDINLGFLPSSGSPRILHGADLQRIAKNRGVELENLQDVCFVRKTFVPDAEQIRAAMRQGIDFPGAKIEIVSSTPHPIPFGELVFPRDGLQSPNLWNGYVRFGDDQRVTVWAKVRITAPLTRVIAVTNIAAGKPIQQSQVRLETVEDFPLDETIARNLVDVVGYLSKTSLRPLMPIRKAQLQNPPDVTRGDLVQVQVIDGAARLSLEGTAQSAGAKGSFIMIRNSSSGKDFRAQVTGKDQAIVSIHVDGGPAQ